MSIFDRLDEWLETVSRDLNAFLFGAGRDVHRKLIIDDKERGGVLYCPQVSYNEVIPLDTCKACAYHEKPSLRNGFIRMCLFSKEKRDQEERPFSFAARPSAQLRGSFAEPHFRDREVRPRNAASAKSARPPTLATKAQPEQDVERRLREIIRMAENIQREARALLRELEDIEGRLG